MHGQGQKSKQKPTTKNYVEFHNQYLRDSYFSDVANDLLADHDNCQLYAEINHTASSSTAVQTIASFASKSPIVTRCTDHEIQLEEGDVENG